MSWTPEDRDKAIIKTISEVNCSNCKGLSMDKTGCNFWCCDIELNNTCYKHELKINTGACHDSTS